MARVKYYDHQSGQWKYADTALGIKGDPGKTPEKGVDYFTEEDKQEMIGRLVDEGVLTYNEQELTEEQKAQARENIGIDQISFDKLTENLDADGFRITNLPLPQSGSEPATKEFVENFTIEGSTYVATDDGEGNVTIRPYLADEDELVFKDHIQNQNNPHDVTAAQAGARPDTWTPTAAEVGAATPQDVDAAKEEAKIYTNVQVKKAAPRNLLDNSDFKNPVNQRGKTSVTEDGLYIIDRWCVNSADNSATVSVDSSGLTITKNNVSYGGIFQNFERYTDMYGKTYTIAICVNDNCECSTFKMGQLPGGFTFPVSRIEVYSVQWGHVIIRNYTDTPITIQRVALYEGEYTAETLPEYQPKGYGAELAECQRYYCNSWYKVGVGSRYQLLGQCFTGGDADFPFYYKNEMRVNPTITLHAAGGLDVPSVYTTGYYPIGDITILDRFGLRGNIIRVKKSNDETSPWPINGVIQLHSHWEASADL